MPTRTHGKQASYGIKGTVTLDGSAYEGAQIWIRDYTEGTVPEPIDDHTHMYTNSVGRYLINLAECTQAYANADSVRIYCKVGNIISKSTVTISKTQGYTTANFTITRRSGMVDGIKSTPLTSGKGGLYPTGTEKGCIDGLA